MGRLLNQPRPDGPFVVLKHRNYRLFFVGGLTSNVGRWFQAITIPLIVFELTGSAAWVGIAGFVQILPMALMSPVGGALADRYPRRRVLMTTQSLLALVALGFSAMWFGGVRTAEAYIGVSALAGVLAGLSLPAWQALVSELVRREQLLAAITLNSAQFNASRMIGPAMAGFFVAALGPGWAFAVNALSYLAIISALALMRLPAREIETGGRLHPGREFAEAARYAFAHRGIRTAIFTVAFIGFFGFAIQSLAVTIAEDVFDRGEQGFGWMLSAVGLGAVSVSPFIARLASRFGRTRVQETALVIYGFGVMVVGSAPTFFVALIGSLLMGAAHLSSASTLNTAIQLQVDERLRAKVLAVYLTMLTASAPIGQVALGQLIDQTSARFGFIFSASAMLVVAFVVVWRGWLDGLNGEDGEVTEPLGGQLHPTAPATSRDRH